MSQQTKLGKTATRVFEQDGYTCIQYHNTVVLKFNEAEIVLNNGGWYTATTKTRMNQASSQYNLGLNVHQHKGDWYVRKPNGFLAPFLNGMSVSRQIREVA